MSFRRWVFFFPLHSQVVPLVWVHAESESKESWGLLFKTFVKLYSSTKIFEHPIGIMTGECPS
jgi:hypothetical protein